MFHSSTLSGILKPSTVLGKGAGSGKRDVMWDPVVTSSSSSELGQDATLPSVELPEFSLPPPDSSSFPASWENDSMLAKGQMFRSVSN